MTALLLALTALAAPPDGGPQAAAETARAEALAAEAPADAARWARAAEAFDALQRAPLSPPALATWWDALTDPERSDRAHLAALAGAGPPPDPWRPLQFPADHPGEAALQLFASLAARPVRCQQDGADELLMGSTEDVDFVALMLGDRFYTPRWVRRLVEVTSTSGLPEPVDVVRRGRGWPMPYAAGLAGSPEAAAVLADADARAWSQALGRALGLDEPMGHAALRLYPPPAPPTRASHCRPLP